ncbi:S46 family peptidase [soil metagenome]
MTRLHTRFSRGLMLVLAAGVMVGSAGATRADEGMWLLNAAPTAKIKQAVGVDLTPAWLQHVQRSAVNVGASGSFVSARGLVMTNHHVASDAIAKLSTPARDLIKDGYYAATPADELKCADTEVRMLTDIRDVSDQYDAISTRGGADVEAEHRALSAKLEAGEAGAAKGNEDMSIERRVVTLFGGGKHHLYTFQRFSDVRLVFCPEGQAAFYGGDVDNFEFPRHDLDVTILRVYHNGAPYQPADYLKFSDAGVKEGDAIFVIGHPGRTQRLLTIDDLKFVRDTELPERLAGIWRMESKLKEFMSRSRENDRVAHEEYFGFSNSRKALTGQLKGLLDPAVWNRKAESFSALMKSPAAQQAGATEATRSIGDIKAKFAAEYGTYNLFRRGLPGELSMRAMAIVLHAQQSALPGEERLPEFRESAFPAVAAQILADIPISPEFERAQLEWWFSNLAEHCGADDARVKTLLAGKSPSARAAELVSGTKLGDPRVRADLLKGTPAAVAAASDAMIAFARDAAPIYLAQRKHFERDIEAPERAAYAKIAAARFAALGDSVYPDATGTLRLSYGKVAGYTENGVGVPASTNFGSYFKKAAERDGEADFAIPARWQAARSKIDPALPFNFVCTADIIGGNSGSPVVNAQGEAVGLIFDGNLQSLPGAFIYDGAQNRALAVDTRAILHALRVIYNAGPLADELQGGGMAEASRPGMRQDVPVEKKPQQRSTTAWGER